MSISSIQRKRLFEEVTRTFYSSGEKPRLTDILLELSKYFNDHPAGAPIVPIQGWARDGIRTDVDMINEAFLALHHNLSVSYEASIEQIQEIMSLTSILKSHLERLRSKRNSVKAQIDDYLFALFNSDGYFMSVSDTFDNLDNTDIGLTTAYVDTAAGKVTLPTNSLFTRPIPLSKIGIDPNVAVLVDGAKKTFRTMSPMLNAFDGLSNTIWAIEIESEIESEVIVGLKVSVGSNFQPSFLSRIELEPWGIEPVQVMVKTSDLRGGTTGPTSSRSTDPRLGRMRRLGGRNLPYPSDIDEDVFGRIGYVGDDFDTRILTSHSKMVFSDDVRKVSDVSFFMRKKKPDYSIRTESGSTIYRYIFGFKDIIFTHHIYDNEAVFVSGPLSFPTELTGDHVIDSVSLVADATTPADTFLDFWVSADLDTDSPEIGDFEWRKISPLEKTDRTPDSIVKFEGAVTGIRDINSGPKGSQLQLIAENNAAGTAAADLNPNPNIVQGTDIWRIAEFNDAVLPSSAILEEGINTVRVLYVDSTNLSDNDLDFWAPYIEDSSTASEIFHRIDIGTGFFDGGIIGESDKYVYVETFVEVDSASEIFIRNFRKDDTNSKNWDVDVYLNGREVGKLPQGTDALAMPWKFVGGLNHIALIITIPAANSNAPQVYDGKIILMEDTYLYNSGTVKLATWKYVDFFHMQHNEVDSPFTFTINDVKDGKREIISRRQPTDNFRFKYAEPTGKGPTAIRIKADLSRSTNNPSVTPSLDLYRLKFLYSD